ncbi:flavin reductase (NADPH) isoform X2 [Bemisia tabaci]|nr:PREDICTED: flavin reductase (NADPH) isoform X2 [Bemisia tabaci]
MKKIAIFGASGMTGLVTTEYALKQGFEVRALLRDPEKLPESLRSQVEVVKGDVTNLGDVESAVKGRDAIIVTLGTRNDLSPTTVMSDGLKNIIQAMKKHEVSVISVCLSSFIFFDREKVPPIFNEINADHLRMLEALRSDGSTLKWIAVCPPHIADTPSSPHKISIGSSAGRAISKQDLGKFFVDALSKTEYYNQLVGIATEVQQ